MFEAFERGYQKPIQVILYMMCVSVYVCVCEREREREMCFSLKILRRKLKCQLPYAPVYTILRYDLLIWCPGSNRVQRNPEYNMASLFLYSNIQ